MKPIMQWLLIPAVALGAMACQGKSDKVDDALNSDLSLAGRPGTGMDTVSAAERTAATTNAAATPAHTAPRTVYHRSSSSSSASSGGTATRSGPIDHVEKHTGRDAAIGAAAGGVLGAVTSKNKVKGGVIGAAAGGILGAVIGNNVDKKKVPN